MGFKSEGEENLLFWNVIRKYLCIFVKCIVLIEECIGLSFDEMKWLWL